MAVSTLQLTWDNLRSAVGYMLGYTQTSTNWSSDQQYEIDECIKIGLRRVYGAYDWNFLRPVTTMTVWGTISGTIQTVGGTGNKTITASSSVFYPTVVGQTIVSTNASYTIATYASGTQVTVGSDASADSGEAFTITTNNQFKLPDDFGSFDGPIHHAVGTGYHNIVMVSEAQIRSMRASSDYSGVPLYAAVRYQDTDNSTDQRCEIMFYPTPGAAYVLTYRYRKLPDALTTGEYPYGAQRHAELIRTACLAAAEEEIDSGPGVNAARYERLLADAIRVDGYLAPETLGTLGGGDVNDGYVRGGVVRYVGVP